jgi:hypothetical protein
MLRTIAAGVVILATLTAFGFWFWITIAVIGVISDPGLGDFRDEVSGQQLFWASVISLLLTIGTWWAASKVNDQA